MFLALLVTEQLYLKMHGNLQTAVHAKTVIEPGLPVFSIVVRSTPLNRNSSTV
jgi:hypothetical protein